MLNYAVITLALLGATICQVYSNELLRTFGMGPIRHHDLHAWKYVETVGAGEGCCLPDKVEADTSFIVGSVEKGKPAIMEASMIQKHNMSQLMRLWYLSHRRPAKAQASLRIRAVSLEPSLFAHMKYGSGRRV